MKRKFIYVDSGHVRKVRLPTVIKIGDNLCIHKKTGKWHKHHKNHLKKNWDCNVGGLEDGDPILSETK